MKSFLIRIFYIVISFLVGALSQHPSLAKAQRDYIYCLSLGAPQQTCLETFLLPEKR